MDRADEIRAVLVSAWSRTLECVSRLSDCAPSMQGSPGLQNLEPGACSCWWSEQQTLRPQLHVSTVRRCSSGPSQKAQRIRHPRTRAYRLSKETGDSASQSHYHRRGV